MLLRTLSGLNYEQLCSEKHNVLNTWDNIIAWTSDRDVIRDIKETLKKKIKVHPQKKNKHTHKQPHSQSDSTEATLTTHRWPLSQRQHSSVKLSLFGRERWHWGSWTMCGCQNEACHTHPGSLTNTTSTPKFKLTFQRSEKIQCRAFPNIISNTISAFWWHALFISTCTYLFWWHFCEKIWMTTN